MFKNATFLSFYFADNQLFSNSETLVSYSIPHQKIIIGAEFLFSKYEKNLIYHFINPELLLFTSRSTH